MKIDKPRKAAVVEIAIQTPNRPSGVKRDRTSAKGTRITFEVIPVIDGGSVRPLPRKALVATNSKLEKT